MRATHLFMSAARHSLGALTEGALIAALIAMVAIALSPVYSPARSLSDAGQAFAKGGAKASSSISMVALDGWANWDDQVTFTVQTTNDYPVASVTCSRSGVVVYGDSRPMYQPNAWDDPGIFTLASLSWTAGAADCRADLKVSSHNRVVTLASTTFHVDP